MAAAAKEMLGYPSAHRERGRRAVRKESYVPNPTVRERLQKAEEVLGETSRFVILGEDERPVGLGLIVWAHEMPEIGETVESITSSLQLYDNGEVVFASGIYERNTSFISVTSFGTDEKTVQVGGLMVEGNDVSTRLLTLSVERGIINFEISPIPLRPLTLAHQGA